MTENEKREKVIKGLECCVNDFGECEFCPYDEGKGKQACGKNLYSDALALLKAQEPVYVDAITVSWIEDQISQHTSETGWTDWWADMCRRFLQEYERRRDEG